MKDEEKTKKVRKVWNWEMNLDAKTKRLEYTGPQVALGVCI
jgi:hypothetical protein